MKNKQNDFLNKSSKILGLVSIIAAIMVIFLASAAPKKVAEAPKPEMDITTTVIKTSPIKAEKKTTKITLDNVITLVKKVKLEHPDIVVAQAIEESGKLTSRRFLEDNNMFGMKKAGSRPTLAASYDKSLYAIYSEWSHSVYDYSLYQAAFARGLSRDSYFNKLQKTYAGNPQYITNLKNIIKENNLKERCY